MRFKVLIILSSLIMLVSCNTKKEFWDDSFLNDAENYSDSRVQDYFRTGVNWFKKDLYYNICRKDASAIIKSHAEPVISSLRLEYGGDEVVGYYLFWLLEYRDSLILIKCFYDENKNRIYKIQEIKNKSTYNELINLVDKNNIASIRLKETSVGKDLPYFILSVYANSKYNQLGMCAYPMNPNAYRLDGNQAKTIQAINAIHAYAMSDENKNHTADWLK